MNRANKKNGIVNKKTSQYKNLNFHSLFYLNIIKYYQNK